MAIFDPFSSQGPDEVPLGRAPLVRVIAQIRFPPIVSLGRQDFIADFQEAIREHYPILRLEQTAGLVAGPMGVTLQSVVWRFQDKAEAWRASLGSDFIALESTLYKDRHDFFDRFEHLLTALDGVAKLSVYDRLGVRYINRVRGPEMENLAALIRAEVLGLAASDVVGVNHSVCESLFLNGDTSLGTRWGKLPPGSTTDPAAIDPISESSWILDLDMFRGVQKDFDARAIVDDGRSFAKTIHTFFRWCVTPQFLQAFGGKP